MTKKISWVLCVTMLLTAGCGNMFEQDPLKKKSDAIKNATDPGHRPKPAEPRPSEAVRINSAEFYSFKEGRTDTFSLSLNVLIKDYTGELEITNLNEFPGAVFTNGEFVWTPPKGIVRAGELYSEIPLKVAAVAKSTDKDLPVLTQQKVIRIIISVTLGLPEITAAQGVGNEIHEGDNDEITVVVHDPDGGLTPEEYPQLRLLLSSRSLSLAPFMSLERVDADFTKRIFTYKYSLNMRDAELTPNSDDASVGIIAVSRFGKASPRVDIKYKIFTRLSEPRIKWADDVRFTPGIENVYKFMVYDPKHEGALTLDTHPIIPVDSTLKCGNDDPDTDPNLEEMECTFTWNPPYNKREQTMTLEFKVINHNQHFMDTRTESARFLPEILVLHVEAPSKPKDGSKP